MGSANVIRLVTVAVVGDAVTGNRLLDRSPLWYFVSLLLPKTGGEYSRQLAEARSA